MCKTKRVNKVQSFLQVWQNFGCRILSSKKFYRAATAKMSALWKHWVVISFHFVRKIWSAGSIRLASEWSKHFFCSKIAPRHLFLGMQKTFGEFHVGESLEYVVDLDQCVFAHARVVRVTEHILTLEVDIESGKQLILGMVESLTSYRIWQRFRYRLPVSLL
jgi:hypothetical protein